MDRHYKHQMVWVGMLKPTLNGISDPLPLISRLSLGTGMRFKTKSRLRYPPSRPPLSAWGEITQPTLLFRSHLCTWLTLAFRQTDRRRDKRDSRGGREVSRWIDVGVGLKEMDVGVPSGVG